MTIPPAKPPAMGCAVINKSQMQNEMRGGKTYGDGNLLVLGDGDDDGLSGDCRLSHWQQQQGWYDYESKRVVVVVRTWVLRCHCRCNVYAGISRK